MSANEIPVTDTDTAKAVAQQIEAMFPNTGSVLLLTGTNLSYNTAMKAVAIATPWLAMLGVHLACETFFQNNQGRYADRTDLKVLVTNRP